MSKQVMSDSVSNFDHLSTAGSVKSITSAVDKDLIAKYDDKRRAKYQVLKELQAQDQGKPYYLNYLCIRWDWQIQDEQVLGGTIPSNSRKARDWSYWRN